jgi:hypothetical protein
VLVYALGGLAGLAGIATFVIIYKKKLGMRN